MIILHYLWDRYDSMKYKNSFFEIEIKEDGTYMHLYPAIADGKKLELKEVKGFLEKQGLYDFSLSTLKEAVESIGQDKLCVKISDSCMEPFNEQMYVRVEKSGRIAYARFYPPSIGKKHMTKEDIYSDLKREKIVYGIVDRAIEIFLQVRQYCLDIPIAKAKMPVPATDAAITYNFNTKPLAKPKLLEDGSVDFHDLNLFCPVKHGELLATLTPHTLGEPGINIYGKPIPQNKPVISVLKYGKNISVSDDKCKIYSQVDGNVFLLDDTVFVSDVFKVPADVDASTGDIEYDGNIEITGMVRTGFSVRAKGDILVNGGVEGATLVAGGNIVIKRGVQGMNRGELRAGKDICALFFESSNVFAKGDVISGSILNSNVVAEGKIVASGRKGFIVGGEVSCDKFIEATSIGNKMEKNTIVKVGVKAELVQEMKEIISSVAEINEEMEELLPLVLDFKEKRQNNVKLPSDKLKHLVEIQQKYLLLNQKKEAATKRLTIIKEVLNNATLGYIKVPGAVYQGTTLIISKYIYTVKGKQSHVIYKVVDGEIHPSGY